MCEQDRHKNAGWWCTCESDRNRGFKLTVTVCAVTGMVWLVLLTPFLPNELASKTHSLLADRMRSWYWPGSTWQMSVDLVNLVLLPTNFHSKWPLAFSSRKRTNTLPSVT